MTKRHENQALERLLQRIEPQAALLRAWPLTGGVSARVTALEIALPDGETRRLVVRQHGAADLAHNPRIADDEFRLLRALHAAGLPVPEPYYAAGREILGTPCLVVAYIEGAPFFAPPDVTDFVAQMAAQLARIHGADAAEVAFLPSASAKAAAKVGEGPAKTDESLDERRIRGLLQNTWPPLQANADVTLHGDYWPGNLLWRNGKLVGVIDWEDAMIGDPLADLANTRLELLWALGIEAMEAFTQAYRGLRPDVGCANLALWDLYAALKPMGKLADWANDDATEQAMREGHRRFVAQAVEALGKPERRG